MKWTNGEGAVGAVALGPVVRGAPKSVYLFPLFSYEVIESPKAKKHIVKQHQGFKHAKKDKKSYLLSAP